jgi:hypothetical protein
VEGASRSSGQKRKFYIGEAWLMNGERMGDGQTRAVSALAKG